MHKADALQKQAAVFKASFSFFKHGIDSYIFYK